MTDDTRDALLMAVAEYVAWIPATKVHTIRALDKLQRAIARARHEQERPEDRG